MSAEEATGIAIVILLFTTVALILFVLVRRQKAKDDELRRAAAARGWTYENVSFRSQRIRRWTGTTDGIAWQAESVVPISGNNHGRQRHRIARWHGAWNPGVSSPVVAVGLPKGKEDLGLPFGGGEGVLAGLARKFTGFALDKAIDASFGDGPGKEVDASTLKMSQAKVAGFVIFANDPHEGARIMPQGLEHALLSAAGDSRLVPADGHRPWILLRPQAVSVSRMERVSDINDLEGLVRAGIALTRAFKFGRPIS